MSKLIIANTQIQIPDLYAVFFNVDNGKVFCFRHNAWEDYSSSERFDNSGGLVNGSYGLQLVNLGNEFFSLDPPNSITGNCQIFIFARVSNLSSPDDPLVYISNEVIPIYNSNLDMPASLNTTIITIDNPGNYIKFSDNSHVTGVTFKQILSLLYLVLGGQREGVGSSTILAKIPGTSYPTLQAIRSSPTKIDTIATFNKD